MKFTIYQDTAGDWRWRLQAANGEIVADSSEGYENRVDCCAMVLQIIDLESSSVTVEME